eukprot:363664-Chlamydomonas_euryale.AAC.18
MRELGTELQQPYPATWSGSADYSTQSSQCTVHEGVGHCQQHEIDLWNADMVSEDGHEAAMLAGKHAHTSSPAKHPMDTPPLHIECAGHALFKTCSRCSSAPPVLEQSRERRQSRSP